VRGPIDPEREVLVRVHEPLSVLDALDADLGTHSWPLPRALARIAEAGCGVVILLNCGESADGLLARFEAMTRIDGGEAPDQRSSRMDLRTYGVGAQILRDLNVVRMRLLARPRKMPSMAGFGLHTTGFLES
jgi:3,4-dihydroxy 2-butanone 4-phosphate synthase/GTP cyclohydrolase II